MFCLVHYLFIISAIDCLGNFVSRMMNDVPSGTLTLTN